MGQRDLLWRSMTLASQVSAFAILELFGTCLLAPPLL
jgi:hypothetical protein